MFSWKYWKNSLITSENHWVRFPFLVKTVFWDSTSYTVKMVLWKMLIETVNVLARLRPCACLKFVSGLWKLEKNMNFWRCFYGLDLVLNYGSDIIKGDWLQLLFYFTLPLIEKPPLRDWVSSAKFQFLDWSFLVLHFDGKVCKWIPILIWSWMDWFCGFLAFCSKMASFVDFISWRIEICNKCWIVFLFEDFEVFRCLVWGVFWSVV